LQNHFHSRRHVIRHQRRYADAQINVIAVTQFSRDSANDPFPFLFVGERQVQAFRVVLRSMRFSYFWP
jgi:hypothetical protein